SSDLRDSSYRCKAADILSAHFTTMEALQEASFDQLVSIDEIGETMAESVVRFFSEDKVIELIESLKELGLNMTYKKASSEGESASLSQLFADKTVVLTGK